MDALLEEIADYTLRPAPWGSLAWEMARLCLLDALACALQSLGDSSIARIIGPRVSGATLPGGARVPGTTRELDPVQAAYCIGTMIRWLDFNDTWLAAEWGHPSDNLGAILAVADFQGRAAAREGWPIPTMDSVLEFLIKAYEIQGILALDNSFNEVGLDHVLLVRVASSAVAAAMLGGGRAQVLGALSNAFLDGAPLRAYRHAPNMGPRKSWAAGDATSRGVRLATLACAGEPGYPTALTAPTWGFQDVLLRGRPIILSRPLGSYVVENILFKVAYPAEFHAQTAVEAAISLHPLVRDRLDEIACIKLETQESAIRIIDKRGPLANSADRDHCLQYIVAVGLIKGGLSSSDYEDEAAADQRIDRLLSMMVVSEDPRMSRDYRDPESRSIANSVEVVFRDGSSTGKAIVEFPLGHRSRRAEAIPALRAKFEQSVRGRLPPTTGERLLEASQDLPRVMSMSVPDFISLSVPGDQRTPMEQG